MSRRRRRFWLAVLVSMLAGWPAAAQTYKELVQEGAKALARGDLTAAEKAFRQAAQADTKRSLPHKYLADIQAKRGRWADAVTAIRKAIALDDRDADAHYNLGTYLIQQDPEHPGDEVLQALNRALELNSRDAQAAQNLGYAHFKRGQFDQAVEAFRRAATVTPSWAPYHACLGEALLRAGKPAEAAAAFEQAAADKRLKLLKGQDYRNSFCDIYLNWARAEEQQGHLGAAKQHLGRLIRDLGDAPEFRDAIAQARQLLTSIDQRIAAQEEERRRRQEEELKKRQDTRSPVITVTGTTGADLVIVADGNDTTTTTVHGVASDDVGVAEVTVGGQRATLFQSRDLVVSEDLGCTVNFTAEVAVRPGENRFEIIATDAAGNKGRTEFVINGRRKNKTEVATEAAQEVAAAAARKWAVVVGVNRYEDDRISPLKFSVRDAHAIHEVLVDPKRAGFAPDDVILLTDDQPDAKHKPTRRNVYDALYILEQNCKPDDLVFIYYSGHGYRDAGTGKAFLLPADTAPHDLDASAIPSDDFLKRIGKIQAKKKVIVLDACHSGGVNLGAKAEAQLPEEWYKMLMRAEGTVTMASCSGNEQSFEYAEKQQGAFTYFLCEGLTGKADKDGNGVVSFQEVSEYVIQTVNEWARRRGKKQTPLTQMVDARFDIPLAAVREVELEQKRQKVMALLTDARIQRYSIALLEKEPSTLTEDERSALTTLELVLKGELKPEHYALIVQKVVSTT